MKIYRCHDFDLELEDSIRLGKKLKKLDLLQIKDL